MATIDSLTLKAVPLGTDTIELNDGKKGTLASLPISTATQTALDLKANTAALGTAASRDVGQAAGNLVEMSAPGTVTLGDATVGDGQLRLYDGAGPSFTVIGTADGLFFQDNARLVYLADVALTSDITTVPFGGTGATTLTANGVLLGNGTSAVQSVAPGTTGNVLTSNGTTWQSSAPSGGSVAVGSITGLGTGVATALSIAAGAAGGFVLLEDMARLNFVQVPLNISNAAATGGNGVNGAVTTFEMNQSATAGSALSFARRAVNNVLSLSGLSAVDFDKTCGFQVAVEIRQVSASSVIIFTFGAGVGADAIGTSGRLTQRGLSVEIRNQTLWRVVHDGTTYRATSTGLNVRVLNASPFGGTNIITCMRVGSGSFQFWLNGVDAGISTGGPTGLSSAQWSPDYANVCFALDTGANTGVHTIIWRNLRLFQQQ